MNIARHPLSLLALAAMLVLGACAAPPGDDAAQAGNDVIAPDPAAPAPAPDPADMATQCDADAAQSYIGQDASEATVAEAKAAAGATRSEDHTSELQSLMR